jgi:hypothetical protein
VELSSSSPSSESDEPPRRLLGLERPSSSPLGIVPDRLFGFSQQACHQGTATEAERVDTAVPTGGWGREKWGDRQLNFSDSATILD